MYGAQGGKACLQWYKTNIPTDADSESTQKNKTQKKRQHSDKPFILALCTPLMAHAHKKVCQASETVFCDATALLGRFNISLIILSTSHVASGIPLGVILTSDAREVTLSQAFEMLRSVLPPTAFFGSDPNVGPQVIMTNDDAVERAALAVSLPAAKLLLCTFYFLQRQWTWLWKGQNKVNIDDRKVLILKIKAQVYAETNEKLQLLHQTLQSCVVALRYPHLLEHMKAQREKRHQ